ncbi:MAG: hypothetical protein IJU50_01795 [Lachnospiraceae bacterium]|nr:hypothetical protein [Lachnospiraceae bacterium]
MNFDPMTGKPIGQGNVSPQGQPAGGASQGSFGGAPSGGQPAKKKANIPLIIFGALALCSLMLFIGSYVAEALGLVGGLEAKDKPYLFYVRESDILCAIKVGSTKPKVLLDGYEKDMRSFDAISLTPDKKHLFFTESGGGSNALYVLPMSGKNAEPIEVDTQVQQFAAVPGGALYLSVGSLYRSDTEGKTDKLKKSVEGFVVSEDKKHVLYGVEEKVYLTDINFKSDGVKQKYKDGDNLRYVSDSMDRAVYTQENRLYISRNGLKEPVEEKITDDFSSMVCVGDPKKNNIQVVFLESEDGDMEQQNLVVYDQKRGKKTVLIEGEEIRVVASYPESISYIFAVIDSDGEPTYYFGQGAECAEISGFDQDTVVGSMETDDKSGKTYAFVYDQSKGPEATGQVVELSLKGGEAVAEVYDDAISLVTAGGGNVFYHIEENQDGSRVLAVNGEEAADDFRNYFYLGKGRMAILSDWDSRYSSGDLDYFNGKKLIEGVDEDVTKIIHY